MGGARRTERDRESQSLDLFKNEKVILVRSEKGKWEKRQQGKGARESEEDEKSRNEKSFK